MSARGFNYTCSWAQSVHLDGAAFNDEPASEDLPDFEVTMVPVLKPWPTHCTSGCGRKVDGVQECITCYCARKP